MRSLVQAEKVMQIAFVLPCAMLLGWGLGWCVDHYFHCSWATVVGLVLGLVAGMVSVIRTAVTAMNSISDRGSK
jgi:F0F1-type ATP synthase assembly protein I